MGNPDNSTMICHCPEPILSNFPGVYLTISLIIFVALAIVYAFGLFIICKTFKEARNLKHGEGQRSESQEYRFASMPNTFETFRRESAYLRRSNSAHGALTDLDENTYEEMYENIPHEYIPTIQEESLEDLSVESDEPKSSRDEDSEEHFYDNFLQMIIVTDTDRGTEFDPVDNSQNTVSAKSHVPRRIGSLLRSYKENNPHESSEGKDEIDLKKVYMRSQSLSRKSVESFMNKFRKSSDPLTMSTSVPGSLKSHRSDSSKQRDQEKTGSAEKKRRNTSNASTMFKDVQGMDWNHRKSGILRTSLKAPSEQSQRRKRKLALSFQEPSSPNVEPGNGSKSQHECQESTL
ncbi:uncharacterized protein LOC131886244 isoform X4 [Tigriopus californicus]|nr:uncharacterized protein LOC131886244 isoform X4 [Tigriopus californicus]